VRLAPGADSHATAESFSFLPFCPSVLLSCHNAQAAPSVAIWAFLPPVPRARGRSCQDKGLLESGAKRRRNAAQRPKPFARNGQWRSPTRPV